MQPYPTEMVSLPPDHPAWIAEREAVERVRERIERTEMRMNATEQHALEQARGRAG